MPRRVDDPRRGIVVLRFGLGAGAGASGWPAGTLVPPLVVFVGVAAHADEAIGAAYAAGLGGLFAASYANVGER